MSDQTGDDHGQKIEVAFTAETMRMLEACTLWRKVSPDELIRAYVEDWLDIDFPESQGRHTRRGIYRGGPIMLYEQAWQQASPNWRDELGIGRVQPRSA